MPIKVDPKASGGAKPGMGEDSNFYQQFGRKLRQARQESGLSQADLAVAIDRSRTSVSNIEKGRQGISLRTFGKLLQVLNVDADQLLPADDVTSVPPSGLISLSQEERDFVERGLGRLGRESHGDAFGTNPAGSKKPVSRT